jgi:integrative and conjugative element protein (TIGR02256 family)
VDKAYESSDQLLGYIGTWHTHPQDIPIPSGIDKIDWKSHEQENPDRPLFFIVVGLKKISIYTLVADKTIELSIIEKEVGN